jgi:dihydrofolate reductase
MKDERRLYVSMMVSLDGYIEGPNRELDWHSDDDEAFNQYCHEMIDSIDLALFGRRSYEMMVQYWPQQADAFGRKMNALPKIVLSRTLKTATWNNTRIVDDAGAIAEVKRQPGKAIAVWGGANVIASLAKLGLIDEYRVIVHPVLLGGGTPLFQDIAAATPLKLVRTTALGEDLTVSCYQPVRR